LFLAGLRPDLKRGKREGKKKEKKDQREVGDAGGRSGKKPACFHFVEPVTGHGTRREREGKKKKRDEIETALRV